LAISPPLLAQPASSNVIDTASVPSWRESLTPPDDTGVTVENRTIRQIVHLGPGGNAWRIRLSNAYGDKPLYFDRVTLAKRAKGSTNVEGSTRPVTFEGRQDVTIAPGTEVVSDTVALPATSQTDLAISIYVAKSTPVTTVHARQRNAIYLAEGDVADKNTLNELPLPKKMDKTLWLSGVDAASTGTVPTIVAFGDSISDGTGTPADENASWPDVLYGRLANAGMRHAVVNAGIAGNRLARQGVAPRFGSAGLTRFERDVLAQPGATAVIVQLGINDIGFSGMVDPQDDVVSVKDIEDGLAQLAKRAHANCLKAYITTLTPFALTTIEGYYSDSKETTRQAVNAWIRRQNIFDGVADIDMALRDPAQPNQLLPANDSGDHLHPNAQGAKAIANAIPLSWFK
jgi:lysophospholipase L1-like esterase